MKTRTLLLAGLSAVALASCGGIRGYKNSVKQKVFHDELVKLSKNNTIVNPDKLYSFSLEITNETNSVDTFNKNGSQISKITEVTKAHSFREFDSENVTYREKGDGSHVKEDANEKTDEHFKQETVIQIDNKNYFVVNLKTKLYSKHASSDPKDYVNTLAKTGGIGIFDLFLAMSQNTDYNYFIENDKVYTIEDKSIDEDTSRTKTKNNVYQFVLNENGFEYNSVEELEIKELNHTTKTVSKTSMILNKKNVKINPISLTKYLEYDEEEEFLNFFAGITNLLSK